jgi:hypothetical protein
MIWDRVKSMTINMFIIIFFDSYQKYRTVQFRITFGKPKEIHLNGRKYQTSSNFFETPTQKHTRRLLLIKKVSEYEKHFP